MKMSVGVAQTARRLPKWFPMMEAQSWWARPTRRRGSRPKVRGAGGHPLPAGGILSLNPSVPCLAAVWPKAAFALADV